MHSLASALGYGYRHAVRDLPGEHHDLLVPLRDLMQQIALRLRPDGKCSLRENLQRAPPHVGPALDLLAALAGGSATCFASSSVPAPSTPITRPRSSSPPTPVKRVRFDIPGDHEPAEAQVHGGGPERQQQRDLHYRRHGRATRCRRYRDMRMRWFEAAAMTVEDTRGAGPKMVVDCLEASLRAMDVMVKERDMEIERLRRALHPREPGVDLPGPAPGSGPPGWADVMNFVGEVFLTQCNGDGEGFTMGEFQCQLAERFGPLPADLLDQAKMQIRRLISEAAAGPDVGDQESSDDAYEEPRNWSAGMYGLECQLPDYMYEWGEYEDGYD